MTGLPRMRFPQQVVEELRRIDPNTQVSEKMIRRLMAQGVIPSVAVGNGRRKLTSLDAVIEHLTATVQNKPIEQPTMHGIRRINERAGA